MGQREPAYSSRDIEVLTTSTARKMKESVMTRFRRLEHLVPTILLCPATDREHSRPETLVPANFTPAVLVTLDNYDLNRRNPPFVYLTSTGIDPYAWCKGPHDGDVEDDGKGIFWRHTLEVPSNSLFDRDRMWLMYGNLAEAALNQVEAEA